MTGVSFDFSLQFQEICFCLLVSGDQIANPPTGTSDDRGVGDNNTGGVDVDLNQEQNKHKPKIEKQIKINIVRNKPKIRGGLLK